MSPNTITASRAPIPQLTLPRLTNKQIVFTALSSFLIPGPVFYLLFVALPGFPFDPLHFLIFSLFVGLIPLAGCLMIIGMLDNLAVFLQKLPPEQRPQAGVTPEQRPQAGVTSQQRPQAEITPGQVCYCLHCHVAFHAGETHIISPN